MTGNESAETLRKVFVVFILCAMVTMAVRGTLKAQSTSGVVQGTVVDPSQAAVPRANVRLENRVSGHVSQVTTGANGTFSIPNIPFNLYHLTVTAPGFANHDEDVDVRASVPVTVMTIGLTAGWDFDKYHRDRERRGPAGVTPEEHTDVDRNLFEELPLESPSSSLSSLVTLGVSGNRRGLQRLFHGLGDHAENSFSVDGQPITDQQSKVFSNQIPVGFDPVHGGDRGRSARRIWRQDQRGRQGDHAFGPGQETTPHGEVTASYGCFGTSKLGFNLPTEAEMGEFHFCEWIEHAAASSILPNSWCFTTRATRRTSFDRVGFQALR